MPSKRSFSQISQTSEEKEDYNEMPSKRRKLNSDKKKNRLSYTLFDSYEDLFETIIF